jgi:hypothetical protein
MRMRNESRRVSLGLFDSRLCGEPLLDEARDFSIQEIHELACATDGLLVHHVRQFANGHATHFCPCMQTWGREKYRIGTDRQRD